MSQIPYQCNLSTDAIPYLTQLQGRTVIVGKNDQNYDLEINTSNRLQREKQIPEAFYGHNVMPTGQGYQSIGFIEKIAPMTPATNDFNQAFTLRDMDENKSLYSPAGGKNYVFDRNFNEWRSVNPILGAESKLVTVAYLSGETYIFFEKVGCFKYNKSTGTLDSVVFTGIDVTLLNGICAAQGFLNAWDDSNTVYRSQAASPLDFTPDPTLGSGSGIPEDIRGKIVVCLPITKGFVVYTTENAVAATFQQNTRFPFIYSEIEGSSGVFSPDQISWQDNTGVHYAWTKLGLQKVNKSKAEAVFPEFTDFLVSKLFEDFDTNTNQLTVQKLTAQLNTNITVIGSRFAVFSYGINPQQFTHAIVFDMANKRFGKIKITHVDVFNYTVPNLSGDITWEMLEGLSWDDLGSTTWEDFATGVLTDETPKEILAFMQNDGTVKIVNFDYVHTDDDGVLLLGKYQYVRERLMTLDEIHVENADPTFNFEVIHMRTMDGKNFLAAQSPFLVTSAGLYRRYHPVNPDKIGLNHAVGFKGTFHIVSQMLMFHQDGRA